MKLRKNQLLLYFILIFGAFMMCHLQTTFAQPIEMEWAASMGGAVANDRGNSVILDGSGNVYVTGRFRGTSDFDPGVGIYNLTSNGDDDVFILKLDALGNFLWAASVGGAFNEEAHSVSTDASDNVYVIGSFGGTIDFDPSAGTYDLTSSGARDVFLLKLDSQGSFLWASSMGGSTSSDLGISISNDALGNVYMTGQFDDIADFNPGVDTFNLTPFTINAEDVFVVKLDSLGSFQWAVSIGGFDNDRAYSISNDAWGNVYVTGRYAGTVDFDPGVGTYNLTSNGGMDAFVLKLDSLGSFLWAASMGGANTEVGYSISTDVSGNVYVGGAHYGTADFDPGVGTYNLASNGASDGFVVKLDSQGNFRWAASLGGTGLDQGTSISHDDLGYLYITGLYNDTVDFDPGIGTYYLTSKGNSDVFVLKLDTLGNFLWASSIGAAVGNDYGLSVAYDGSGNVHVTGQFAGTVDFDPGVGTYNLTSNGGYDAFILKYSQCSPSSGTDVITSCISHTWIDGNTYTSSNNTATHTISSGASNGCDSIVTLDLTIVTIDTSVTIFLDDNWLANASSGTFQWIECAKDSILPNETSAAFEPFTDGSYAVIITDNVCSDTSACIYVQVVDINELQNPSDLSVYPNPINDVLIFEFKSVQDRMITIYNSTGQAVVTHVGNEEKLEVRLEYVASGLYFFVLRDRPGKKIIAQGKFAKR